MVGHCGWGCNENHMILCHSLCPNQFIGDKGMSSKGLQNEEDTKYSVSSPTPISANDIKVGQ